MSTSVTTSSERKSYLPTRLRSTTVLPSTSNIPRMSRPTTTTTASTTIKPTLTTGNRVLVNGLKSGTLRYLGTVQFAQGIFCGVELDEPEGKHDGQVNDVRYFQCQTNHGVFVPREKVILETRDRAHTLKRSNTINHNRLQPAMTRSMTISSSSSSSMTRNDKIEQTHKKPLMTTSLHLPDIIPNSPSTESHQIIPPVRIEPEKSVCLPDEPLENLEADFTDSVSLILHQLQQPFAISRCNSYTISEEGTIDDDDVDDDDESITESNLIERKSVLFESKENLLTIKKPSLSNTKTLSYSNKSLASSTASINRLKVNIIDNKKKPSLPTPVIKRDSERKLSMPVNTFRKPSSPIATTNIRKGSLVPPKRSSLSTTPFGSQSKLNRPFSTSNSVYNSQSDLASIPTKPRGSSCSVDLTSNKKPEQLDHQLLIQKTVIHSLESTNKQLQKQYKLVLNRFDLMHIINRFYINQNDQIKSDYERQLIKLQKQISRLKNSLDQTQQTHEIDLDSLREQHQTELQSTIDRYEQELQRSTETLNRLTNQNQDLEKRCTNLQTEVDRFYDEMKNSEYADPLLRRVDILEKDRNSLETALEIKTQELTQLRIQMNEQIFEREDQEALQKRLDMVEHRNQDLLCLLRNWQLNEIAATVERDELKEQLFQLERDKRQLIFENETLLYGIRQRSTTIACMSIVEAHSQTRSSEIRRERTQSCSELTTTTTTLSNECQRIQRTHSISDLKTRMLN